MKIQLDRVDARAKLKRRRDPYWHRLTQGRYIGFRKLPDTSTRGLGSRASMTASPISTTGCSATSRHSPKRPALTQPSARLTSGSSTCDMGGSTVRGTVKAACEAYLDKLTQDKSETAANDARGRFKRLIYSDPIATVELMKLAPRHFVEWKKRTLALGGTKGTYNRNATPFRRALNLCLSRREVASNHAWVNELKAFKDADGRRELYLNRAERQRLLTNATPEAQRFIKSLLLLPFRPGDVAKLKVEHFDAHQRILSIPHGKTKRRIVPLTSEAVIHFKACAQDKLPSAWLVSRNDGRQWNKDAWADSIDPSGRRREAPGRDVCIFAATCRDNRSRHRRA